jgi:hypothetical protein
VDPFFEPSHLAWSENLRSKKTPVWDMPNPKALRLRVEDEGIEGDVQLALLLFFPLFPTGLAKPFFKASSGQASEG